ncbi:MAG: MarR family winged helix-turn-helix transcriptional regulator [Enterococcus sp.]
MKSETEIYTLIRLLRSNYGNGNGRGVYEQKWIEKSLEGSSLKKIVKNLSITSLHILSALETNEKTGIELAEELSVTRGGITRAAKKLAEYKLITSKKLPHDDKKIYYFLTEAGQEIAEKHDLLHVEIKNKIVDQLSAKYSEEELNTVATFLKDLATIESELQ